MAARTTTRGKTECAYESRMLAQSTLPIGGWGLSVVQK